MKEEDMSTIFAWIYVVLIILSIVHEWLLRVKTKLAIKNLEKDAEKRSSEYVQFCKQLNLDYDDWTSKYAERQDTLSRENNKLREQNELMKERLRNLGIKDFDLTYSRP